MKKEITAIIILTAVIILLIFNIGSLEKEKKMKIQELKTGIDSEYNGTISEIIYEEDCIVCMRSGCESLGKSCWKANVTTEDRFVQLSIDSSGNVINEQSSRLPDPLPEGGYDNQGSEPPAENCEYQYTEQQGDIITKYTNTGCNNPRSVCRMDNLCARCSNDPQCVGFIETSTGGGQQLMTTMPIKGTQYNGIYNHSTGRCTIDDGVTAVFDNATDFNTCYDEVVYHAHCDDGGCDFT